MDKINTENSLTKIKTPGVFYFLSLVILFFIIIMFLIFFDVNLNLTSTTTSKSQQQIISEIFIVLFFSLIIFGLCVLFLPSLKELKNLFYQISNVTYVIIYTIFAILFYTMMPSNILSNIPYSSYIITIVI